MLVIPGPNGIVIGEELAQRMNWDYILPEYKIYNDGEFALRIPQKIDDDVIIIQSCDYPQHTNLFQLLNLVSTVKSKTEGKIIAFVPYLCYARADREVLGGEAISARTVIQLLENTGVDHLIVIDIHNPDIFKFAKSMKTTNIFPTLSWAKFIMDTFGNHLNLQIVAPDSGAIERARVLANQIGVPYTSLDKIRDPISGNVSLTSDNAKIESEIVILVDDIMSTGSTLVEASSLLKTLGVHTIHVLLAHAIGTDSVDKLQEIGNGIVIATQSIPNLIGTLSLIDDLVSVIG